MANRKRAVAENVPGTLFVDDSCIYCGTCFHYAPLTFVDTGASSAVHCQPVDDDARLQAHRALLACPTNSIGSDDPAATRAALATLPDPVCPGVWFNGFTNEQTFGAWSYVIASSLGNVLMDCPRPIAPVFAGIARLGGIARIVLSHKDDIAGHVEHAAHWQAPRIAHEREAIAGVELPLQGDDVLALADDLLVIPTPGHTAGSICLLFEERVLFTGDHLWWNQEHGMLSASPAYCWHDWSQQLASIERLLTVDFSLVCPGHGAIHRAASAAAMRDDLERALERLHRL